MLLNYDRTAACICPFCSSIVEKSVSMFDFSGGTPVEMNCTDKHCQEHCVDITPRGKKYKIEVECPVCTEKHTFSVVGDALWKKKITTLKCPETGMDIFFFGDSEKTVQLAEECAALYEELAEECAEDSEFTVVNEMLRRLGIMASIGALKCGCGNGKIQAGVTPEGILIACGECGRVKLLPINEQALEELLDSEELIIE